MLWRILHAWDGKLPENVRVFFANTGEEMPATLDFVRDCATAWNVPIEWVEYRLTNDDAPTYTVVDYESAARAGEPFDLYLQHVERMCAAKGNTPYLPGRPLERTRCHLQGAATLSSMPWRLHTIGSTTCPKQRKPHRNSNARSRKCSAVLQGVDRSIVDKSKRNPIKQP